MDATPFICPLFFFKLSRSNNVSKNRAAETGTGVVAGSVKDYQAAAVGEHCSVFVKALLCLDAFKPLCRRKHDLQPGGSRTIRIDVVFPTCRGPQIT